jgi:hypothetical protein
MPEAPQTEPEWVQRMRAAGYNIRVGTIDEPMSEVPEVMFYPPVTRLNGLRRGMGTVFGVLRSVFRPHASTRRARHAPVP